MALQPMVSITSYGAETTPYALRPDNSFLVPVSALKTRPLVVLDGSQVGLRDNVAAKGKKLWFTGVLNFMSFITVVG